jgi:hypothetical protein
LSAWVRPQWFGNYNEIFRKEDNDQRILFSFQENGRILALGLNVDGYVECDARIDPAALTDGAWHHCAATFDGNAMCVYLDGTRIGILERAGVMKAGGPAAGYIGSNHGTGEHFQGAIDDLRIYGDALTAEEIAAMWREGKPAAQRKSAFQIAITRFKEDDPRVADEYRDLVQDISRRNWDKDGIANKEERAKQTYHKAALFYETDRDPADVVLRRTRALFADLKPTGTVSEHEAELTQLEALSKSTSVTEPAARVELFAKAVKLRRKIAFANPVVKGMDKILFIKREALPGAERVGSHMCDQYWGHHATQGGKVKGQGLFILENALSDKPTVRNVLENSIVQNGRLKGQKLDHGGFLAPDLSYDGKTILFSWTPGHRKLYDWNENTTFHIFKVNVDGSNLVQLTDGSVNDIDPCWLPNGRIVFISERRGGYGRCHGRPVPSFTLHTMHDDGSDIVCLSPHETNEWHPSVDNNGMVVYTRWDYVDRGFNQAHHPWITYPDGRDARAINGNTHTSERTAPHMVMDMRSIPGSQNYVAIACGHHTEARGSVIIIDPSEKDDDAMAQVRRFTPDQLLPEAEFSQWKGSGSYASPWPLNEKFHLCVYDHDANAQYGGIDMAKRNYGIYLLDAFGNRELLYRDPAVSCLNPIPLRPRKKPPVIPHMTLVGQPRTPEGTKMVVPEVVPQTAQVGVINVYDSLRPYPEGVKVTHLRIWQIIPKTTPIRDNPPVGLGTWQCAKAVLGTVPVESDGSAYWEQPVGIPVLYHAIGADGAAIQGMRSATYVAPGERLLCTGCHEPRADAPVMTTKSPLAMQREPSKIKPSYEGTRPFSFPRLVQPVLDRNCVTCHADSREKGKKAPDLSRGNYGEDRNNFFTSINSLKPHVFYYNTVAFAPPSTIPGRFGAEGSKLYQMLKKGHHELKLSDDDMRKLIIWMDSNGLFYGHNGDIKAQADGKIVPFPLQ